MESANVEGEAAPSILWARWKLANVRVVMFRIPFSLSLFLSLDLFSAAADKFTAPLFYLPPSPPVMHLPQNVTPFLGFARCSYEGRGGGYNVECLHNCRWREGLCLFLLFSFRVDDFFAA